MSDPHIWGHSPLAGCSGCPFLSFDVNCRGTCDPTCNVTKRGVGARAHSGAPEWCPLRVGPVHVVPTGPRSTEERLQRLEAAMYGLTQRERR